MVLCVARIHAAGRLHANDHQWHAAGHHCLPWGDSGVLTDWPLLSSVACSLVVKGRRCPRPQRPGRCCACVHAALLHLADCMEACMATMLSMMPMCQFCSHTMEPRVQSWRFAAPNLYVSTEMQHTWNHRPMTPPARIPCLTSRAQSPGAPPSDFGSYISTQLEMQCAWLPLITGSGQDHRLPCQASDCGTPPTHQQCVLSAPSSLQHDCIAPWCHQIVAVDHICLQLVCAGGHLPSSLSS